MADGQENGEASLVRKLGDDLWRAELTREAVRPLSELPLRLSLQDAYAVQKSNIDRRVRATDLIVGHKVGLTSAAMQRQMGVDQPDSGILMRSMSVDNEREIKLAELMSPRVETELAFRMRADLCEPRADAVLARAAVGNVFLALEIIDTRYTSWRISLEDSVADNASSARFVAGPEVPLHDGMNLDTECIQLSAGGRPLAEGRGEDILGNPFEAVAWLARRLAASGEGLEAGQVVLAGAVHVSLPLDRSATLHATSTTLPSLQVSFMCADA